MASNDRDTLVFRWFLIAEALLLCAIEACVVCSLGMLTNVSMYLSVLVAVGFALHHYVLNGKVARGDYANLIVCGLVTTAAADLFMTLLPFGWAIIPGFVLFCVVQSIYAVYLRVDTRALVSRAALIAMSIAVLACVHMLTPINVAGMAYLVFHLCNVVRAWRLCGRGVPLLFCAGLTCFFLCDASIAVRMLSTGVVHNIAAFLVWVFYVPAQALIALATASR